MVLAPLGEVGRSVEVAIGGMPACAGEDSDDVVEHVRASDATFDPLLAALSLQELQELTVTIGFYMLVSRFLETFGVDIEQPGGTAFDVGSRS